MRLGALILSLGVAAAAQAPSGTPNDSLDELLHRAGEYVAAYERDVSAIVADEDYTQRFIVEPSTEVQQPRLHLWLPVSMDETYRGAGLIDGHATYSNFRRFSVTTEEIIKAP